MSNKQQVLAQQQWELENQIVQTENYHFDKEAYQQFCSDAPWKLEFVPFFQFYFFSSPHYFKLVKMSAVALLKMTMHAMAGGDMEVMGMVQGKVVGDTFIILDAFALPVQGTETRVSAGDEANAYLSEYLDLCEKAGRNDIICGWYHSHPGYGVWLSGIDIGTQRMYQKASDPFIAIVIEPKRTAATGKVDVAAFRAFPENYKPKQEKEMDAYGIPSDKAVDFGFYYQQYYKLPIEIFKSESDNVYLQQLWSIYWIKTLSASPIIKERAYIDMHIADMSAKLNIAESVLGKSLNAVPDKKSTTSSEMATCCNDASKIGIHSMNHILIEVIKDALFNAK